MHEIIVSDSRIVAIGLLTRQDLERLGASFRGAIPVPADEGFKDLLRQLDQVELAASDRGVLLVADPASHGET